jgi:pimeloyl-ACP methyl ester carboxylesterase
VQLATIRELARYWATDYDWRACEVRLNARPQFTTEIDGVRIHFIHVRSRHENALLLIMTYFLVEAGYPRLAYFNEVDKGGHFAAWEEPDLFTSEVRAAFRSLR